MLTQSPRQDFSKSRFLMSMASRHPAFGHGPAERQNSVGDLGQSMGYDIDTCLRLANYEDTVRQLDLYYGIGMPVWANVLCYLALRSADRMKIARKVEYMPLGKLHFIVVKRQLLRYQSAVTGLFPAHSADTDVAHIRDSIYCAAAIWSLYQAYRRIDDDRGKSYELGGCAVKCMRGILRCWTMQATRVEQFKQKQTKDTALHACFDLHSGKELPPEFDGFDNHLQIDIVSLYLLFLVQMSQSGLQVIYTLEEVRLVQNLVYYVERAYRTPDYGMWGRGSKYNDGTAEIHASSIGMAKSALEAINGCNLFGDKGSSGSVIYVDIDAHNRNRSIFETLLPRESSSKNTDACLLCTVSWPCFGTHDEVLYSRTKSKIARRLRGSYGFRRYLRDGFGTAVEDPMRRFYHQGETKDFEHIESEWPIFYLYMIIDGVFKGIPEQVEEYQKLLKTRMKRDHHGDPLVPKYFFVPKEVIEYERQEPGSQLRQASAEGSASNLFLWGQSLYIIASLLTDNLLHVNELDPIRRYLPSYNRPRKVGRYSAFQGTASDLVVQIVLIAESMRLQAMMATYGIQTQTPHEVEPVQIWSPKDLVRLYQHLGVCKSLGLKGRPTRPIGALGTSKVYRVGGQTVLCFPLIFEVSEFYLSHDMSLLIDDIKTELHFVGRYWRLSGRPTVCILIREEHMRDPQFKEMLELLAMLKKGHCDGLKVRTGRLQNLLASSCIVYVPTLTYDHELWAMTERITSRIKAADMRFLRRVAGVKSYDLRRFLRLSSVSQRSRDLSCAGLGVCIECLPKEHLDFVSPKDLARLNIQPFTQVNHDYIGYQSLTDVPRALAYNEPHFDVASLVDKPTPELEHAVCHIEGLAGQAYILGLLLQREGLEHVVADRTVRERLVEVKREAGVLRHWSAVRLCSSLLHQLADSISPFITTVLVHGKQLTVGVVGGQEIVLDKPMTPSEIQGAVYRYCPESDPIQAVLQQEVLLYCGRLIATNPDLFSGVLKIRVGWVLHALRLYLSMRADAGLEAEADSLENRSPSEIRRLLMRVLTIKEWASEEGLTPLERRKIEGCLGRVPDGFYQNVWHVLEKTPKGVCVQGNVLEPQPTLTHMTISELNFALLVEAMLNNIPRPEYRHTCVELLMIVATILQRNPELRFRERVDLDRLIGDAVAMFSKDVGHHEADKSAVSLRKDSLEPCLSAFYSASPATCKGYLARAVVNVILTGDLGAKNSESEDEELGNACRVS